MLPVLSLRLWVPPDPPPISLPPPPSPNQRGFSIPIFRPICCFRHLSPFPNNFLFPHFLSFSPFLSFFIYSLLFPISPLFFHFFFFSLFPFLFPFFTTFFPLSFSPLFPFSPPFPPLFNSFLPFLFPSLQRPTSQRIGAQGKNQKPTKPQTPNPSFNAAPN